MKERGRLRDGRGGGEVWWLGLMGEREAGGCEPVLFSNFGGLENRENREAGGGGGRASLRRDLPQGGDHAFPCGPGPAVTATRDSDSGDSESEAPPSGET